MDWKRALIVGPSWIVLFSGSVWVDYKVFMALSAMIKSALPWC